MAIPQNLMESLLRRVEHIIRAKQEQLNIYAHGFGIVSCPHTFDHTVSRTLHELVLWCIQ